MAGLLQPQIDPADLMANVRAAHAFEFRRQLNKIGKPVDRDEWHMTPQTVNAYYSSGMNEIVFPAAILQDPFFNPERDDAATTERSAQLSAMNRPRLRRPRFQVRRRRQAHRLVERSGPASVRNPDPVADRAVQQPGAEAGLLTSM